MKILPDEARDYSAIIPYTPEELEINGDGNDDSKDMERENECDENDNPSVDLYLKEVADDKSNDQELHKLLNDIPQRPSTPFSAADTSSSV